MDFFRKHKCAVFFVVGLSFYWSILRDIFFQVYGIAPEGEGASQDFYYLLFLVCNTVMIVASLALSSGQGRRLLDTCRVVATGVIATAVSAALLLPLAPLARVLLQSLAMLCCSSAFILLTYGWYRAAQCWMPGVRATLAAFSFFGSFVVSLLACLPQPFAVTLPLLTWMVGPGCLVLFFRYTDTLMGYVGESRRQKSGAMSDDASLSKRCGDDASQTRARRLTVLIALFLVVGAVVRGLSKSGQIAAGSPDTDALAVCGLSIVLSLLLALLFHASTYENRTLLIGLAVLMMLFFLGMLIASVSDLAWAGGNVVVVGRTFLVFFLWLVLADMGRDDARAEWDEADCVDADMDAFRSMALFVLVDVLSGLLSYAVVPTMMNLSHFSTEVDLRVFSLAGCFVLIAGTMVTLVALVTDAERDIGARRLAGAPLSEADVRRSVCDALAHEYGLTDREREVLFLLSQGHSQKRIATEMYISTSTEQSHAKALYQKLSVHSKQEVIDRVRVAMDAVLCTEENGGEC